MNFPGNPAIVNRFARRRDLHNNYHYIDSLGFKGSCLYCFGFVLLLFRCWNRPAIMKTFASLALFAAGATAQIIESTSFGYDKTWEISLVACISSLRTNVDCQDLPLARFHPRVEHRWRGHWSSNCEFCQFLAINLLEVLHLLSYIISHSYSIFPQIPVWIFVYLPRQVSVRVWN